MWWRIKNLLKGERTIFFIATFKDNIGSTETVSGQFQQKYGEKVELSEYLMGTLNMQPLLWSATRLFHTTSLFRFYFQLLLDSIDKLAKSNEELAKAYSNKQG